MAKSKEEIAKDIYLIFEEVARLDQMGRDAFKKIDRSEVFCDLPHPSGTGRILCGRLAYNTVTSIARLAGERGNLIGKVTLKTLREPTEQLLVHRFLVEKRSIDQKQIDRLLSSIERASRKLCEDKTHFVPCHLMATKEPSAFSVGPVIFHNQRNFRKNVRHKLKAYAKEEEPEERRYMRQIMFDALNHYRHFNWIAEVTIRGCDHETSAILAERSTRSAVNGLHLMFRAKNTEGMRVGGPALQVDRRGGVTIDQKGKLEPYGSVAWVGQRSFPENWSDSLKQENAKEILRLFGVALEAEANPSLKRPVSRRILDAAQWFGDASTDEQPSTRIIKFVTALERMVMTDEKQDVSKLVSDRNSGLCCVSNSDDRSKWKQDVKDVYDMRSQLLHGSISPFDEKINSVMGRAAKLGEEAIIQALFLFGEEALIAETVATRRLAKWFDDFVDYIDARLEPNAG